MRDETSEANAGTRLLRLCGCLLTVFALTLAMLAGSAQGRSSTKSEATQSTVAKKHGGKHRRGAKSKRYRQRFRVQRRRRAHARRIRTRRLRANRRIGLADNVAVSRRRAKAHIGDPGSVSTAPPILDAGFEDGLFNWNTAGVGEAIPTVVNDIARDGSRSGKFVVSGSQHRSELIFGGNGGGSTSDSVRFHEGDEYWYGFSFYIVSMVYGKPGAHNLIMQFKGDDDGSPAFGLQLWDYDGDDDEYEDNPKGLWSHGSGMGGDRFLALAPEHTWHDVAIHFKASGAGAGFYEVYLDGNLVDSRSGVSMIADGADYAYIKDGLYRNGDTIPGTSEIRLDAARLGHSRTEVAPG